MAFVTGPALPTRPAARAPALSSARAPATMSVTRRAALRAAGLALAGLGAQSALAAGGVKLESVKGFLNKGVESLDYDEELLDVGPDPKEKNKVDIKKPPKVNKAVVSEKKRMEKEESEFNAMVSAEKAEAERVRNLFKKK